MDETPRQLISETRDPVPAAPGRPAREDYEYRRCGTCNVFMATEPLAGRRMTKVTARRTKIDWAHFLNDIAERHPGANSYGMTPCQASYRPQPWRWLSEHTIMILERAAETTNDRGLFDDESRSYSVIITVARDSARMTVLRREGSAV